MPLLQRLYAPWTLYRCREGSTEVLLIWRNRLPALILVALLIIELILPARVWVTLLIAFTIILAVASWWAWHMTRSVRVWREWSVPWVQVGDLLKERFTLVNDSPLPVLWIEVRDHSTVPGYNASTVRAFSAYSTGRWNTGEECRLRGEYRLGPWEAYMYDPFGFFAVVQREAEARNVLVYPPIARRLPFALPQGAGRGSARTSHRSWEATVNVGGVRAYLPGDPRHHIHWPTTARRSQFYVKEFDQETGGDIWLVVDLDREVQVGQGGRSTEEMGIIVAASVAALLLDAGRAVGLITYGPERYVVTPARGRGHLWELLHVLARVRAADSRPLARVLEEVARAVPTGNTALVISPSLDPAWVSGLARLQGRGIGVATLLLDAPSFTAPPLPPQKQHLVHYQDWFSPQAKAMRALLAEAQVETEIIHADTPLLLRPPTGQVRRWEFKVLGTGRAVAVATPWGVRG